MIAESARTVVTKLREATPRERAGLAVLAALLTCTAAVYAMDWAASSAEAAASAAQRSADAVATLSALEGAGYRQQLETDSAKVWRWSRVADDFAGEETLAELEAMAAQAGFGDAVVALVEQPPPQDRVATIEASISGSFDWGSFLGLLEAVGDSDLSIVVRSVDVSDEADAQRMTVVLSVPVIEAEARP